MPNLESTRHPVYTKNFTGSLVYRVENMRKNRSFKSGSMKKQKLVCFGEWFGQSKIDSPYYIFTEALKDEYFTPYWITKNRSLYIELRTKGIPCLLAYSIKGIITQIRCKYFVSNVNAKDFFVWALLGRRIYINIGHGSPLKYSFIWRKSPIIRFIIKLRMKTIDYYNFFGSSAEIFDEILMRQYSYKSKRILRVPPARADRFESMTMEETYSLKKKLDLDQDKKTILFAPTHRDEGKTINHIENTIKILQNWLEDNSDKFQIILKPHFYDIPKTKLIEDFGKIKLITTETDINSLLALCDCLIGDYSSAVFDYYYMNKPVIGYCYDLEEYTSYQGGLYFEINQVYDNIALDEKALHNYLDLFRKGELPANSKIEFTDGLKSGDLSVIAWKGIRAKFL